MEKQVVIDRLINEFSYSAGGANLIWERIAQLTPMIADAFEKWWTDQTLPMIDIGGYTLQRLMSEHDMKPIAAFLTLDWLLREPAAALMSLKKGHDRAQKK